MNYYRIQTSRYGSQTANGGILQNIARFGLLIVGAVIGFGVLLFTASAALILVFSLIIFGLLLFVFLWLRAKFLGKSVGEESFERFKAEMLGSGIAPEAAENADDGDVIDARRTPDGWTVDE